MPNDFAGGIRPEDWNFDVGGDSNLGGAGRGGFDFGGLLAGLSGGGPGMGMYAAGKGIGVIGDFISNWLGGAGKERKASRKDYESQRGGVLGSIGEKPFEAGDIGQYYMKMIDPQMRKKAQSIQDITGNVTSADAMGAMLEDIFPTHMGIQAGLKERSAMAGFQGDIQKRLAAFRGAIQRMINA